MATISWLNAVDGDFTDGSDWTGGVAPSPGADVAIDVAGVFTVTSSADEQLGSLSLARTATLDLTAGAFQVGGTGSDTVETTIGSGGTLVVGDGATLDLYGDVANAGTIDLASAGDGTILVIEGFSDTNQVNLTFSGAGQIVLSDNADNLVEAAPAVLPHVISYQTVSGAGNFGGGSGMEVSNRGTFDATGTNALDIDLGSNPESIFVNLAPGVVEGAGTGGLVVTASQFGNIGTVEAADGSSVTLAPGTSLDSNDLGDLVGGTWKATDVGHGATITLTGAAITTLDATVVLSGADSVLQTGTTLLDTSLTSIAGKGELELLAGRSWVSTNLIKDSGLLELAGGTFAAGRLTVAGTVSGFGAIAAPVVNDGLIDAKGGDLVLQGVVSGSGVLEITAGATLELARSPSAGESIAFLAGQHGTLRIDHPSSFVSAITGWGLGDTLQLANVDAVSATMSGGGLTIELAGGGVLNYANVAPEAGLRIVLSKDSDGGTDLTLYKAKAPAVALMAQHMATMSSVSAANGSHPSEPAGARLAMLAMPH